MPTYVDQNGFKYVQLDDGALVPVNVSLSLDTGTLVQLTPAQLAALQTPTFPSNFPLPSSQVTDLKTVTVANFPTSWTISNFPSGFTVSNLPATYPLPTAQENILSGIQTRLNNYTLGFGANDVNTLRVAIGTQTATSYPRSSVSASTTAVVLAAANASRLSIRIYNDSTAILYLGFGSTNPTSTSFTLKLYPDDYFESAPDEARSEFRGVWAAANGAARITEGL